MRPATPHTLGRLLVLLVLVSASHRVASSQACCSAGVPLARGLELTAPDAGAVHALLTYDLNALRDVFDGSRRLDDDTRDRTTQAVLVEAGAGLSEFWSVGVLLSYVNHRRLIRSSLLGTESGISVSGPGDALVVLSWLPYRSDIVSQTDLSISAGVKIPVGGSDARVGGVLLPADLQPGTGSWDLLFRAALVQGFMPSAPLMAFGSVSYRLTGTNKRYGPSNEGYAFGDELIVSAGLEDRSTDLVNLSLALQFRRSLRDRFGGNVVPNTGGSFITAAPAVAVHLTPTLVLRGSYQYPVLTDVNGTQLTTSAGGSVGLFVRPGPMF